MNARFTLNRRHFVLSLLGTGGALVTGTLGPASAAAKRNSEVGSSGGASGNRSRGRDSLYCRRSGDCPQALRAAAADRSGYAAGMGNSSAESRLRKAAAGAAGQRF